MSVADSAGPVVRAFSSRHADEPVSTSSSAASSPTVTRTGNTRRKNSTSSENKQQLGRSATSGAVRSSQAGDRCYYTLPLRDGADEPLYANLLPRHRLPPPVKPPRRLATHLCPAPLPPATTSAAAAPSVTRSHTLNVTSSIDRRQHLRLESHQSSPAAAAAGCRDRGRCGRSVIERSVPASGQQPSDDLDAAGSALNKRSRGGQEVCGRSRIVSRCRSPTAVASRLVAGSDDTDHEEHICRELLLASQVLDLGNPTEYRRSGNAGARTTDSPDTATGSGCFSSPLRQRRHSPSRRTSSEPKRITPQRSAGFDTNTGCNIDTSKSATSGLAGVDTREAVKAARFDLRHCSPGKLWEYIEIPNRYNERGVDVNAEPMSALLSGRHGELGRQIDSQCQHSTAKESGDKARSKDNNKISIKTASKLTTQLLSDLFGLSRVKISRNSTTPRTVETTERIFSAEPVKLTSSVSEGSKFRLLSSELYSKPFESSLDRRGAQTDNARPIRQCGEFKATNANNFKTKFVASTSDKISDSMLKSRSSLTDETLNESNAGDSLSAFLNRCPTDCKANTRKYSPIGEFIEIPVDRELINRDRSSSDSSSALYKSGKCSYIESSHGVDRKSMWREGSLNDMERQLRYTHVDTSARSKYPIDLGSKSADRYNKLDEYDHNRNLRDRSIEKYNTEFPNRIATTNKPAYGTHQNKPEDTDANELIVYNDNCVRVIINGESSGKQHTAKYPLSATTSTLPRLVHRSVTCITTGSALPRSKSMHTLREESVPSVVGRALCGQQQRSSCTIEARLPRVINTARRIKATSRRTASEPQTSSALLSEPLRGADHERRTDPSGASNSDSDVEPANRKEEGQRQDRVVECGGGGHAWGNSSDCEAMRYAEQKDAPQFFVASERKDTSKLHAITDHISSGDICDSGVPSGSDSMNSSACVKTSDVVQYFEQLHRRSFESPTRVPSDRIASAQHKFSADRAGDKPVVTAYVDSTDCHDLAQTGYRESPHKDLNEETQSPASTTNSFSETEYGEYDLIAAAQRLQRDHSSECSSKLQSLTSNNVPVTINELPANTHCTEPDCSLIARKHLCSHEKNDSENNDVVAASENHKLNHKTCSTPSPDSSPEPIARSCGVRQSAELQCTGDQSVRSAGAECLSGTCSGDRSGLSQSLAGFSIDRCADICDSEASVNCDTQCVNSGGKIGGDLMADVDAAGTAMVTDSGVEIDSLSIDSGSARSHTQSGNGDEISSPKNIGKRCNSSVLRARSDVTPKRLCSESNSIVKPKCDDNVTSGKLSDDSSSRIQQSRGICSDLGFSDKNDSIDNSRDEPSDKSLLDAHVSHSETGLFDDELGRTNQLHDSSAHEFVSVISVGDKKKVSNFDSSDEEQIDPVNGSKFNETIDRKVRNINAECIEENVLVTHDSTNSSSMNEDSFSRSTGAEESMASFTNPTRSLQSIDESEADYSTNSGLADYFAGLDAPAVSNTHRRTQHRTPEIRRHQRNSSANRSVSPPNSDQRENVVTPQSDYNDDPPDDFHDEFGSDESDHRDEYDSDEVNSLEDNYSNSQDSFNDDFYNDEPRCARPIDFTLTTIIEESCEDSDYDGQSNIEVERSDPSQLEKYYFFELGNGSVDSQKLVNEESECSDVHSETSGSFYNELVDGARSESGSTQSSMQYFRKGFLGLNRHPSVRSAGDDSENQTDGSGSVGSDSESQNSPEQRRKKVSRFRSKTQTELNENSNINSVPVDQASVISSEDESHVKIIDENPGDKEHDQLDINKQRRRKRNGEVSEREDACEKTVLVKQTDVDDIVLNELNTGDYDKSTRSVRLSNSFEVSTSRDSGFLGSSDDLLKETNRRETNGNKAIDISTNETDLKSESANKEDKSSYVCQMEQNTSQCQNSSLSPPCRKLETKALSRSDSFNNWSSDEETNIIMGRLRQVFRSTINSSQRENTSGPSNKPVALVNLENVLSRMMRSVPGLNEDQVREIVEYLSSEDNGSDSYDSSDHTSSDLEGTGTGLNVQSVNHFDERTSLCYKNLMGEPFSDNNNSTYDTDVLCQKLVARLKDLRTSSKFNSPPLLSKVFDHIGDRLTTFMREVSSGDSTSNSDFSPNLSAYRSQKDDVSISSQLISTNRSQETSFDNSVLSSNPATNCIGNPVLQLDSVKNYDSHVKSADEKASFDFNQILRDSKRNKKKEFDSCHNLVENDTQTDCKSGFADDKWTRLSGRVKSEGDVSEKSMGSNSTLVMGRPLSSEFSSSDQVDSDSTLKAADSYDQCIGEKSSCRPTVSGGGSARFGSSRFGSENSLKSSLSNETIIENPTATGDESRSEGAQQWHLRHNRSRSAIGSCREVETSGSGYSSRGVHTTGRSSVPDIRCSTAQQRPADRPDCSSSSTSVGCLASTGVAAGSRSLPRHCTSGGQKRGPVLMGVSSLAVDSSRSARYRAPGSRPAAAPLAPAAPPPSPAVTGGSSARPPQSESRASALRSGDAALSRADRSSLSSLPLALKKLTGTKDDQEDELVRAGRKLSDFSSNQSSLLGSRSSSMASVCSSGSGESAVRHCGAGAVPVRGEVQLSVRYCSAAGLLEVLVQQCRELAPVDTKRSRSDPYVKVYLLPDHSKSGKRKTKTRKHTLAPVFNETLKFGMCASEIGERTLWLSVWHCDMFGRNEFLGEVRLAISRETLLDTALHWYPLQERSGVIEETSSSRGSIVVALKFSPDDADFAVRRTKSERGSLLVMLKEAKNLVPVKANGHVDPFCKSVLLPARSKCSKQKTTVARRSSNPRWSGVFSYPDLSVPDLRHRALEISVWDHGFAANEFLGGVRLNLATGEEAAAAAGGDCAADCLMHASDAEVSLWRDMLQRPGFWVERALPLRSLGRRSTAQREH